jgi:hypothetical protein
VHRNLTTSERVFLAMAARVVMNPVVMVRCRGSLPVERVEHAIQKVQRRHPALQVRVVVEAANGGPGAPWFSSRDVPPAVLRVVERESDEHWREVVRDELNTPMPIERGPLIRFVLVRDEHACELICTTDHVNADGRSGLFVLRDVLRCIDEPTLRLVPLRERSCFDDYLPTGPLDLRLPDAVRGLWAERTRAVLRRFDGESLRRLRARAVDAEPEPIESTERAPIEFVHRRLDVDRTTALIEACRARDNTVLSALIVACADALATVTGRKSNAIIGCTTPIDIRSMLTPSVGDDFGIYAWAPTSYHALGPNAEFWGLAARAQRIVRAYRSMPALMGMRWLLDAMDFGEDTPLAGAWERTSRLLLDGMMVVSNLGQVSLPERLSAVEVEIESFGFFAMIPNVDFVLGVQSFRGVLELDYCCSSHWTRRSVIEGVADRVEATLDGAIGRASFSRLRF